MHQDRIGHAGITYNNNDDETVVYCLTQSSKLLTLENSGSLLSTHMVMGDPRFFCAYYYRGLIQHQNMLVDSHD